MTTLQHEPSPVARTDARSPKIVAPSAGAGAAGAGAAVARRDPASRPTRWALAGLRIATGFVFLWAFVDKLFGFHYATPAAGAWIRGGSPTRGFLSHLDAGPLRSMFTGWAGAAWADWLFMLALFGVGVAVVAGVALRISAVAGTILMVAMWLAEWPLATVGISGSPTGSTNPIVDYHIVYALALIACAAAGAGATWGLGRIWTGLGFVDRHRRWLA